MGFTGIMDKLGASSPAKDRNDEDASWQPPPFPSQAAAIVVFA